MSAEFLDPLDIRQVGWHDGRPTWITLAPLRYCSAVFDRLITVPAEFVTDLASTPRLLLSWFIAGGRAPRPAVVHDLLYAHPDFDDRAKADRVLLEAMAADPMSGTNAVTRALMYAAVRAGGWWAWAQHDKRSRLLNPVWSETQWPSVEAP